ncbi:formyltransferase family protein [Komagataeibacter europaeus]|uniref:formyltransferase family protein n=1 Tax=Komagataeibacter europaeus TaxID=33995 RepID=UPI0006A73131|nr:formyltransferase family protein [Komagataeibacter europaeus]
MAQSSAEPVVSACYMQMPANKLSGRCVSIRHAFLPGFKERRPHHQAFEQGTKLNDSTVHYVTSDLDEGPSSLSNKT